MFSTLKRNTPLRKVRLTPRRKVVAKPKPGPSAVERAHVAWVRTLPCLVCGAASTAHHVTSDGFKRIPRSDRRVVPLCNSAPHHQLIYERDAKNPQSVEGLGHAGFTLKYGIDLLAEADRLWREHNG